MDVPENDWPGFGGGPWTVWGKSGQRTALSIPNNAICNGHPSDAAGEDLASHYYARELRSLSKGDAVAVGEVALAVATVGWIPVGSLHEVRTDEYGTHPLPPPGPVSQ